MGRPLVLDASAGLALVRGEAEHNRVAETLERRAHDPGDLLVPTLFWLELVNVLTHRYGAGGDEVMEAIVVLDRFGLETIELDRPGVLAVLDAVERRTLTAYDAVYLALAEAADADLLTLDTGLARAAGARAVALGDEHSLAEAPEPYAANWASWRGADEYLAALERRVERGASQT